ncbi:MAG: hypothetical protein AAF193_02975 [Bacteroidota bacterium]
MLKSLLSFFAIAMCFVTYSQCAEGEVSVYFDLTTDAWGYEAYWEIVPVGNACGDGTIVFGGNDIDVNCDGAGEQDANGANGYPSNSTFSTDEFLEDSFDTDWIQKCIMEAADQLLPRPSRLQFCFGMVFIKDHEDGSDFGFYYGSNNNCFLPHMAFISSAEDAQKVIKSVSAGTIRDHCDLIINDSKMRFHSIACIKINVYMIPSLNTR